MLGSYYFARDEEQHGYRTGDQRNERPISSNASSRQKKSPASTCAVPEWPDDRYHHLAGDTPAGNAQGWLHASIGKAGGVRRAHNRAQGHLFPSPPPTCPGLRPDPTFGISLINITTRQALCERNPDGIAQPASTTKVMSALLVKEYLVSHNLTLDAAVTAEEIDKEVEWDAAVAYLQVDQAYSVRTLLSMMSIVSAADATMALARFVAGSRDAFLNLMNQEATQLGMTHTHFTSPYGYAETPPDNWQNGESTSVGNYSSAHDLALLTAAFARYPDLVAIFGATDYHEGDIWLYRSVSHVLPDSWVGLATPDEPSPNAVNVCRLA